MRMPEMVFYTLKGLSPRRGRGAQWVTVCPGESFRAEKPEGIFLAIPLLFVIEKPENVLLILKPKPKDPKRSPRSRL